MIKILKLLYYKSFNKMVIKKCQISCAYFWGFNRDIDLDIFNTKEKLINQMLNLLEEYLINSNLLVLKEKLDLLRPNYHIHDELNVTNNEAIYICNHDC